MPSFASIIDSAFAAPVPNEDYTLLRSLKQLHPGKRHLALVEVTFQTSFPINSFLSSQDVDVEVLEDEATHELLSWNANGVNGGVPILDTSGRLQYVDTNAKGKLISDLLIGKLKFHYTGTDFLVYKITWRTQSQQVKNLYDFVFDDVQVPLNTTDGSASSMDTAGHVLIAAVYRWAHALKDDELWVFQGGQWMKDKSLFQAIRNSKWDDIVLEEAFLNGLRRDTRTFFANRQIYDDLDIAWKRGLLLLGPPGNGKTETIKILLKESGQTALYVKSFASPMGPEAGVRAIFDHARSNAPCILVIEDLDSMVTPGIRSFFLNELDGLAPNEGILTIATTNHPEKIDDAILNRPSRFDVKYNFALPSESLRSKYALKWLKKLTAARDVSSKALQLDFTKSLDGLAKEITEKTEGWSFAFLKELFISFQLRLAHDKASSHEVQESKPALSTDELLLEQVKILSSQILKVSDKSKEDVDGRGEGFGMNTIWTPSGPIFV